MENNFKPGAVSGSNPFGIEINVQWLLVREKHTRRAGLVAKRGFVLQYFDFDNPRVLGRCVSATPYVEPMIRPWGRLHGSVQLGLELAYLNRVYDEQTNPTNLFFSLKTGFSHSSR